MSGLAEAVERGEAIFAVEPVLTPEQKKARDTVRKIDTLFNIIKMGPDASSMLQIYPWHKDIDFRWIDFGGTRTGRDLRHPQGR